jgi:sporulation protein YqfC
VNKRIDILHWLAEISDLEEEPVPGNSLVEIVGGKRILVENHNGVKEYEDNRIAVLVNYGLLHIKGQNLKLRRITKDHLLIMGSIHSVEIERR